MTGTYDAPSPSLFWFGDFVFIWSIDLFCTEKVKIFFLRDSNHLAQLWVDIYCLAFQEESETWCVYIISTYTNGQPPEKAAWFHRWLQESVQDFRVPRTLLSHHRYAIFGLGNSLYQDHFNVVCTCPNDSLINSMSPFSFRYSLCISAAVLEHSDSFLKLKMHLNSLVQFS